MGETEKLLKSINCDKICQAVSENTNLDIEVVKTIFYKVFANGIANKISGFTIIQVFENEIENEKNRCNQEVNGIKIKHYRTSRLIRNEKGRTC